MTLLGSKRSVIVCGWVGGDEGRSDLKELKARMAADLGGLRALSSQLPAFSLQLPALISSIAVHSDGRDPRVKAG
jgi:hypothetical protein